MRELTIGRGLLLVHGAEHLSVRTADKGSRHTDAFGPLPRLVLGMIDNVYVAAAVGYQENTTNVLV